MSELLREQDEKRKQWANKRFHGSCRRLSHARGHITACLPACDCEAMQRIARRGKLAGRAKGRPCLCLYLLEPECWRSRSPSATCCWLAGGFPKKKIKKKIVVVITIIIIKNGTGRSEICPPGLQKGHRASHPTCSLETRGWHTWMQGCEGARIPVTRACIVLNVHGDGKTPCHPPTTTQPLPPHTGIETGPLLLRSSSSPPPSRPKQLVRDVELCLAALCFVFHAHALFGSHEMVLYGPRRSSKLQRCSSLWHA